MWVKNKKIALTVGFSWVSVFGAGCGSGTAISYPAIAPVVNSALPKALKASSASSTGAVEIKPGSHARSSLQHIMSVTPSNTQTTLAQQYISKLFSEYFANINNGQAYQGYLNNMVLNIDMRMANLGSSSSNCTKATPSSYVIDLSSIDSMLKFTLNNLQCSSTMSGNAAGSGVVFGNSGNNYSMWLSMGPKTGTYASGGGFMLFANISNYGSTSTTTPESVDGMLVEYSPASVNNRTDIARFKAITTTNTFELFIGSTQQNIGGFKDSNVNDGNGANIYLGAGFRMISDGSHIYSDGTLYDSTSSGTYYAYNVCLNAADASLDSTASDCQTLANSFTLNNSSASLNFAEISGYASATLSGASASPCSGSTSDGSNINNCIPSPTTNANQTTPTSTVTSLFAKIFPISNASSVAASY